MGDLLLSMQLGGNYSNAETETAWPLIKMGNLDRGRVNLRKLEFVASPVAPAARDRLRNGDVLFNTRNTLDLVGKVALWRDELPEAYFNSNIARLEFDRSRIASGAFLNYALNSRRLVVALRAIATGTTSVAAIYGRDLVRLVVPVPSLREQDAIAEALSDADAWIESLEQLLAKKHLIKQGAMQELLTGRTRLPGFERLRGFTSSEEGAIPRDWITTPLLACLRIASGQVDPREMPYADMTLVAPDHIESASGRLLARVSARDQRAISGKYLFLKGDIVYSKIRPYLQKATLADFDGLCSADMYPLRAAPNVSARFMLAVLLGHRFTKYAESVSIRSGMPKINREELSSFNVVMPATLTEQSAIATILSDMDAELSALDAKLAKARLIKQGMMQELLTGRTRLV